MRTGMSVLWQYMTGFLRSAYSQSRTDISVIKQASDVTPPVLNVVASAGAGVPIYDLSNTS